MRTRTLRLPIALLAAVPVVALLGGCGGDSPSSTATPVVSLLPGAVATPTGTASPGASARSDTAGPGAATPIPTETVRARADAPGTFRPFTAGATAITYDTAVVPDGATATVTTGRAQTRAGEGVAVKLVVTGLQPRRGYGAHLHTAACGADPAAAGPHYQHTRDPKAATAPSVDPKFANPRNEVWLDFTTNAKGAASATTTHPWTFDGARPPRSLVLHATKTQTAAGKAGTAGARAACLTLPR